MENALIRTGILVLLFAGALCGQDPVVYRVRGERPHDNLGFSFALLDDVDGDGVNDYVAGTNIAISETDPRSWGYVNLISGKKGTVIRTWRGTRDRVQFGHRLGALGDLDGDGKREIVTTALGNVIVVLSPVKDEWQRIINVPTRFITKNLSASFAAADLDGDGKEDLIVGNPVESLRLSDGTFLVIVGRVLAYSTRTWEILWDQLGDTESYGLGSEIAVLGDLDGDGVVDLAVGEPMGLHLGTTLRPGRVRILSGRNGSLLRMLNSSSGSYFGERLKTLGDLDGDGYLELAISSPGFTLNRGDDQGRVDIYSTKDFQVIRSHVGLEGELNEEFLGDALGFALGGAGDVDLDGIPDYLIGAYRKSSGIGYKYGRLDLRSGRSGRLLSSYQESQELGEWLGNLSPLGDVDGDTRPEFLIVSPYYPQTFPNSDHGEILAMRFEPEEPTFLRGDANGDGRVNISDSITILRKLFLGIDGGNCLQAYDADADGILAVRDYVRVIGWCFLGGFAPSPPFPECGRFGGLRPAAFTCQSSPCPP